MQFFLWTHFIDKTKSKKAGNYHKVFLKSYYFTLNKNKLEFLLSTFRRIFVDSQYTS